MPEKLGGFKAKDIMKNKILSAEKEMTVAEAVRKMNDNNVGALVILSPIKDPLGIFTERDLLKRVVGQGLDPKTTNLGKVMTEGLVCAQANDNAMDLLKAMFDNNFRHLPVLEGRRLIGIISLRDFFSVLLR